MLYHFKHCEKYKSLKARVDSSQSKFTFLVGESQSGGGSGSGNSLMVAKYCEKTIGETLLK
jgi:hypothetical protein